MKRAILVCSALLLSGCVYPSGYYGGPGPNLSTSMAQVDRMVDTDKPVEYRVGFRDGCDSAFAAAGNTAYSFKKDTRRMQVDTLYRDGWDVGFLQCQTGGDFYNPSGYFYPTTYWRFGYYPGAYYSGFYGYDPYYPWYGYSPYLHLQFGYPYSYRYPGKYGRYGAYSNSPKRSGGYGYVSPGYYNARPHSREKSGGDSGYRKGRAYGGSKPKARSWSGKSRGFWNR